MIFKSIQLQGFKSFVDKTLIEFPAGITAIVGPNGSGKSNIMDALRWVFGEQRASELRGGDMEDVIFAGSDKRRSANMAEVALTMSDIPHELSAKWGTFSEITVSRRIYRTGEREYLINNSRCKLKDIKEIFYDTGLGSKSISIIEQERVTRIVNSTPEELRYFLEETAGVIKFKERKKEAQTRLRQTEENLARLQDILNILSSDMINLAAQVEKVNRYRSLKDSKDYFEKSHISLNYSKLVADERNIKNTIASSQKEIGALSSDHAAQMEQEIALQKELESVKEITKLKRIEYEEFRDRLSAAESSIKEYETNLVNADAQKKQLHLDIKNENDRLDRLTDRKAEISENITVSKELRDDFLDKKDTVSGELADLRVTLENTQSKQKEISKKFLGITQELSNCNNQLSLKESEYTSYTNMTEKLTREYNSLKNESEGTQEKIEALKLEIARIETEKSDITQKQQQANEEYSTSYQELEKLKKTDSTLEIAINTFEKELTMIDTDIMVKLSGGKGTGDKIKLFNPTPLIDYLDQNSKNRYNLYGDVLLFKDETKEELLKVIDGLESTIRFTFESEIQTISDELKNAEITEIAPNLYYHNSIYKKAGNDDTANAIVILQKRRTETEQNLTNSKAQQDITKQNLEQLQIKVSSLDTERKKYDESIRNIEIDYSKYSTELKHIEDMKLKSARNLSIIEKERENAADGAKEALKQVDILKNKRKELALKQTESEDERLDIEEKLGNLNDSMDEKREEYSSAEREYTKYVERISSLESEMVKLEKDIHSCEKAIASLHSRLEDLAENRITEWKAALAEATASKEDIEKSIIIINDTIKNYEGRELEISNSLHEIREKLSTAGSMLRNSELKIAEANGKLSLVSSQMETLATHIREVFNQELSVIWQEYLAEGKDLKKIRDEINRIDQEITDLGPLNMMAEEEYAQKDAQHKEQSAQMLDVQDAILNISNLIAEIDESTAKMFAQTFSSVQKYFTEVFTEFFGQGSASLRLTNPDDMLTTGVELNVNPPGKKVSNKNLLSGGEKALAALTLLFALFLQKPTPFCFLDEVDAPLDDANAGRFIKMVRSLSDKTQFIIITHKHQTMAAADSLYGVTMQDAGVSKILSVELAS